MALGEQIKLVTLQRRGPGTCINLSNRVRERLGWNRGDALRLDIVKGALIVTKVILPTAADVIQNATRGDVQTEAHSAPDEAKDV